VTAPSRERAATDGRHALHIRDARPDEHDAIRALTLAACEQYASRMPHWELYRRDLLATLDQAGPETRIVAEQDGVLVGSVLLYPASANVYTTETANAGWPEVRLLAVAPEARGQGVGRALLDECIRRARRAGETVLGLHTEDLMEVAVGMYKRRGFVRVPQFDFSPADGVLVKAYRLRLDDSTVEQEPGLA
jgi:predicted N-acetyltransferase YhbS